MLRLRWLFERVDANSRKYHFRTTLYLRSGNAIDNSDLKPTVFEEVGANEKTVVRFTAKNVEVIGFLSGEQNETNSGRRVHTTETRVETLHSTVSTRERGHNARSRKVQPSSSLSSGV